MKTPLTMSARDEQAGREFVARDEGWCCAQCAAIAARRAYAELDATRAKLAEAEAALRYGRDALDELAHRLSYFGNTPEVVPDEGYRAEVLDEAWRAATARNVIAPAIAPERAP